ncbi:hypothetical protein ACSQ67_001402 [Phaseolus vulgaris]
MNLRSFLFQLVSGKIRLIRSSWEAIWDCNRVTTSFWFVFSDSLFSETSYWWNQCYPPSKPQDHAEFDSSSPSRDFRAINCRTFQTGCGILPTPLNSHTSPLTKSPKTPITPSNTNKTRCRTTPNSAPVPIDHRKVKSFSEHVSDGGILLSELWAGPTYSNSPPPSSLPIPKFSVRPKRSVSLDLPGSCPEIQLQLHASSAPSSPCGDHSPCARDLFDSATKALRRILNLSLDEE